MSTVGLGAGVRGGAPQDDLGRGDRPLLQGGRPAIAAPRPLHQGDRDGEAGQSCGGRSTSSRSGSRLPTSSAASTSRPRPYLHGYVATKMKPAASAGRSSKSEAGRAALGAVARRARLVARMDESDVKNLWAVEWLRWPGYGQFWGQLVREHVEQKMATGAPSSVHEIDTSDRQREGLSRRHRRRRQVPERPRRKLTIRARRRGEYAPSRGPSSARPRPAVTGGRVSPSIDTAPYLPARVARRPVEDGKGGDAPTERPNRRGLRPRDEPVSRAST